jgi:hypothetical protein
MNRPTMIEFEVPLDSLNAVGICASSNKSSCFLGQRYGREWRSSGSSEVEQWDRVSEQTTAAKSLPRIVKNLAQTGGFFSSLQMSLPAENREPDTFLAWTSRATPGKWSHTFEGGGLIESTRRRSDSPVCRWSSVMC